MDPLNCEGTKVEEKKESLELNKQNLAIFKDALHKAAKSLKQERTKVKGMIAEYNSEANMWMLKRREHQENFKKLEAELNEARAEQEKLLAKAYAILLEQGWIWESPKRKKTEKQNRGVPESKASTQKNKPFDKATRDFIFQMISQL